MTFVLLFPLVQVASAQEEVLGEEPGLEKPGKNLEETAETEAETGAIRPRIKVTLLKRLLCWRSYQLQLKGGIQSDHWELKDGKKLPFLLKLDKEKGTIYGVVLSRENVELPFRITTRHQGKVDATCTLRIR